MLRYLLVYVGVCVCLFGIVCVSVFTLMPVHFLADGDISQVKSVDGLTAYLEGGEEVEIRDPNLGYDFLDGRDVVGDRANVILLDENCLEFQQGFDEYIIANKSGETVNLSLPEDNSYERVACPRDLQEDGILVVDENLELSGLSVIDAFSISTYIFLYLALFTILLISGPISAFIVDWFD